MLRFSKILLLVVFCGVAVLVAPPATRAEPVLLINGTNQTLTPTGADEFTFSGKFPGTTPGNTFTVNVLVSSNSGSNGVTGVLQVQATVTETFSTRDQIKIVVRESGYTQNTNGQPTATFSGKVNATITGPGALTFSASSGSGENGKPLQWTNGTTDLTFSTFPPNPDATFSGSGSTMVSDDGSYPMTADSTTTGGDISFNFVLKNTLNN